MGVHHHGDAIVFQLAKEVQQLVLGGGVQPGKRLVQQQQPGVGGQGASQQGAASLASRELADEPVPQVGQTHLCQRTLRRVPVRLRRPAKQAQTAVPSHHRDVGDAYGEVPVHQLHLGHVAHQATPPVVRLPEDPHLPSPRLQQAQDRLEQGRLAGAVGPDDAHDVALRDLERDVLEDRFGAVSGPEPLNVQRDLPFRCVAHSLTVPVRRPRARPRSPRWPASSPRRSASLRSGRRTR